MRKTLPVNTIKKISENITLKVIEINTLKGLDGCKGCYFDRGIFNCKRTERLYRIVGACSRGYREDDKNVIFKRIDNE